MNIGYTLSTQYAKIAKYLIVCINSVSTKPSEYKQSTIVSLELTLWYIVKN